MSSGKTGPGPKKSARADLYSSLIKTMVGPDGDAMDGHDTEMLSLPKRLGLCVEGPATQVKATIFSASVFKINSFLVDRFNLMQK